MSIDLSKIKGISDEVKEKLAKVTNKEEFDALVEAENLSADQLKELTGGGDDCACDLPGWFTPECPTFICVSDFVCCPIDK